MKSINRYWFFVWALGLILACDPPDDKYTLHLPNCKYTRMLNGTPRNYESEWHLQGLVADTANDTIIAKVVCR